MSDEEEKRVSEEELVNTYQKHFDKNLALRLLKNYASQHATSRK